MKRYDCINKLQELVSYFIFGAISFMLNIVIYFMSVRYLRFHYLAANIFAWIISVVFSFVSNKLLVFQNYAGTWTEWMKQGMMFLSARLITGAVDMLGMFIMVDVVCIEQLLSKITMNIIVIIINYGLSKLWIFRKSS